MVEGEVQLDTTKSSPQLIRLRRAQISGAGFKRLSGLTQMKFHSHYDVKLRATQKREGFCINAESIDVELGFKQFNVYIIKRYRPGSCQYRVTKKHEMKHVNLYRKGLHSALPEFRAAIDEVVSNHLPLWSENVSDGRQQLAA